MTATINVLTEVSGENQLSAEDRTYYERSLISTLNPITIHGDYGQKKSLPKNMGTTVQFRKPSRLTPSAVPTALTEGSAGTPLTLTITPITVTPSQYGAHVILTDRLIYQAQDDLIDLSVDLVGKYMGETFDNVYKNGLMNGTERLFVNNKTATDQIDNTCKVKVKDFKRAKQYLQADHNKPYASGYYIALIHTDTSNDLQNDPEWKEAQKNMPEKIFKGEIGCMYGIRFIETDNGYVEADGGATTNITGVINDGTNVSVYKSLVLAPDAYAVVGFNGRDKAELIIHPLGSTGHYDPLNQKASVGSKGMASVKILDEERMYRVEHACAA